MPSPEQLAAAVLECVRSIPAGRVLTYGDVAEYVGWRGPRWIGRVLAESGDDEGPPGAGTADDPVPWHRVVPATGRCAEHIRAEQLRRLRAEGTPIRNDRVDLKLARWNGTEPPPIDRPVTVDQ